MLVEMSEIRLLKSTFWYCQNPWWFVESTSDFGFAMRDNGEAVVHWRIPSHTWMIHLFQFLWVPCPDEAASEHRLDKKWKNMCQKQVIPKMTVHLFYQNKSLISIIFFCWEFLIEMSHGEFFCARSPVLDCSNRRLVMGVFSNLHG